MNASIRQLVTSFIADDNAQDLVEYALLAAFVALATMAGLRAIENVITTKYVEWDTNEQNLWAPPDP